jgi:Spy/CpxP family protein refolding chaperone
MKRNWQERILTMAQILIGLVFAVCALAQMSGPGDPMGPGGPMGQHMMGQHMMGPRGDMRPPEELKDFLGLDDKQVGALEQIAKKSHETMRTEFEALRTNEQQLRGLIEKAADPTAAGKLLFEIEAKRKAMPEIRNKAHAEALAVLNDAQKTKLKELRQENADRAAARQAVGLNLIYPPMPMGPRNAGPMMQHGPRQGSGTGFRHGPGPGPAQAPGAPMPDHNERPR